MAAKQQQKRGDMTETPESTVNMEEFLSTVGELRSLIEKTSRQAEELERRHGAILSAPTQDKRNKKELEQLNNETKRNANLVRAKLKSMQKDFNVDENSQSASVIQRIQKNQHSHLTRWFAEVMRGYHKAQVSFREKCKAQIQRQLEIVDKVTTDEELEEMLQRDNLAIFISDVSSQARISSQALSEIESRHQDIICLESSIKELHEIFVDTAMLLEIQGDLINNIEKNVTSAAEYVDISKDETYKAVAYKKNPYKVTSLPSFFKPFKRKTTDKTATDQNTSDLSHD
ncbi:syntaxin-2-like isoform X1 [Acanthopagrus latus]|uniref:syntaxin-2-like isoform X1 n=2 Tax=Acanthopagrus latus TaxID=8177 RepID=UPI00187CEC6F|nr:syntaxin-2-like isoform X1 [Acanthopagrus latus]